MNKLLIAALLTAFASTAAFGCDNDCAQAEQSQQELIDTARETQAQIEALRAESGTGNLIHMPPVEGHAPPPLR